MTDGYPGRSQSDMVERCIAYQRRRWSELLEHDDGTPGVFDDLARRSAKHPMTVFAPRWSAQSAFTPSSSMAKIYPLPPELLAEWDAYAERWHGLLALNPLMRVADMLEDVSESHDASSFPCDYEDEVLAWVRSGFAGERPFDDRNDIDTPAWRERFHDAFAAGGFRRVVWDDGLLRVLAPADVPAKVPTP